LAIIPWVNAIRSLSATAGAQTGTMACTSDARVFHLYKRESLAPNLWFLCVSSAYILWRTLSVPYPWARSV